MSKKLSAWADISGDVHFELREGTKMTTWWLKGVESTSARRGAGNSRIADMFREMADALDVPRETRPKRAATIAEPDVEIFWDEPPYTSPTPGELKLAAKAQAVTVQGGKWFNGDDLDIPFMAPNGKEGE